MGDHPLRPPTDRRLGGPLPHQLANQTQAPPIAPGCPSFTPKRLCGISPSFLGLSPSTGQIPTCYSPVRHSPSICIATNHAAVRLACVKHTASVQSEPGSNSPLYIGKSNLFSSIYLLLRFCLALKVTDTSSCFAIFFRYSKRRCKCPHLLLGLYF